MRDSVWRKAKGPVETSINTTCFNTVDDGVRQPAIPRRRDSWCRVKTATEPRPFLRPLFEPCREERELRTKQQQAKGRRRPGQQLGRPENLFQT